MTLFLCATCGTSYPEADAPPVTCPICTDERQYVPTTGQEWTTAAEVASRHGNVWHLHEPGLCSLRTVPRFAIDQRAFLIQTPAGNVLWDCIANLDPATETLVRALGGLHAIAISHPHYYTRMQDWAQTFEAPVHVHADDRRWVMRPDPLIRHFDSETLEIVPGVTAIRLGGHFAGGTVLHWAGGAGGAGVLLSGDIVQVGQDTARVSFLWSYPNLLPLPARTVRAMAAKLEPWRFERLHNAFAGGDVLADAKGVVARSAARYIDLVERGPQEPPA